MDVTDNRAERRYELPTDTGPAIAAYQLDGDTITFTHTVVPEAAEGQGVGTRLIAGALADAHAHGLKVVPRCPFVRAYLERHPEAATLAGGANRRTGFHPTPAKAARQASGVLRGFASGPAPAARRSTGPVPA